ncbi:unnamed protein product [Soboliphyme baturini]|uniref:MI domain-containing protein n=1 Tax=Soboliphyme baturini TaxID=241478 RepID=A0A183ISE7_9BILA|nr:unnamed protein product [Soboliphyme baturini]
MTRTVKSQYLCARKRKRQQAKLLKKAKHIAYSTRTDVNDVYSKISGRSSRTKKDLSNQVKDPTMKRKANVKKCSRDSTERSSKPNNLFDEDIYDDTIDYDDIAIKKYAKLLKFNKRKGKGPPRSFVDDGLADLLELCQSHEEENTRFCSEIESDSEDIEKNETRPKKAQIQLQRQELQDSDLSSNSVKITMSRQKKKVRFSDVVESSSSDDDDPPKKRKEGSSSQAENGDVKEDIYGRCTRSDCNPEKEDSTSKTLNRLLSTTGETSYEDNADLVKEMKGLSEFNVVPIYSHIVRMYESNPKHVVKEAFAEIVFQCVVRTSLTPPRLCLVQCLLVALLHSNCSAEISSFFVEYLVHKVKDLQHDKSGVALDDSSINNVYMLFAYLYALKVICSELFIDLLKQLASSFSDKDAQLLVLCFQSVGYLLRKEKSMDYVSLVSLIQERSNSVSSNSQTFLKAMASDLVAICGRKGSKVHNCDPSLVEEFLRLLRGNLHDKRAEPPLPFRLEDVVQAPVKGRWWIVGSSFENRVSASRSEDGVASSSSVNDHNSTGYGKELLQLAKANHMNSDLRRNIFCTIMSAEDYIDAFEKLLKIVLNNQQEREIVYILVVCCINEQPYNPFYGYVLGKLCQHAKRFTLTTQFAVWDKLKVLNSLQKFQRRNLALLMKQLIVTSVVSLKILKVVEFESLDKKMEKMVKFFFIRLIAECTPEQLKVLFTSLAANEKLRVLCNGISIFLKRYVYKNRKTEKQMKLNDKIFLIEEILCRTDRNLL